MTEFIQNYILQFPKAWQFNVNITGDKVDSVVKAFAADHRAVLSAIRDRISWALTGIQTLLRAIPWIVLVLGLVLLTWKLLRSWKAGVLYGAFLTYIGCCGMWNEMIQTLSLVILAVAICILLGFPLGILIATSPRANRILRPLLDTMQTIPSWVYLVPMIMLFSTGSTPALFATVIYGIVPMVRMTSHALTHVDADMLEASLAYGATRFQTLVKVQIPQATPTIMTGVNQTIMMCISMVVTAAMVGGNGLGMELLVAINQVRGGKALFLGLCVVIIAVILDRLTQAAIKRTEVEKHD